MTKRRRAPRHQMPRQQPRPAAESEALAPVPADVDDGLVVVEERERVEVVQRTVSVTCAWCGEVVHYSGHGRKPRYCGRACRQRAYEARTADRRTTAATIPHQEPVREVVREVEVRTRTVVRRTAPVLTPVVPRTAAQWANVLQTLVDQLGDDRSPVHREHWKHQALQRSLAAAYQALHQAHPGGLEPPR